MVKDLQQLNKDAEEVKAYLDKLKGKAVKIDGFGLERGIVKGPSGKEGGSYRRASRRGR